MATSRQRFWRGWSWLRGARIAALSAAAGLAFLAIGGDLEEDYGLGSLFQLRGPTPAPADVVIVGMDRASAESMGLGLPPRRWPRDVHARLTDVLAAHGASA